jgi:hypothetical protein
VGASSGDFVARVNSSIGPALLAFVGRQPSDDARVLLLHRAAVRLV